MTRTGSRFCRLLSHYSILFDNEEEENEEEKEGGEGGGKGGRRGEGGRERRSKRRKENNGALWVDLFALTTSPNTNRTEIGKSPLHVGQTQRGYSFGTLLRIIVATPRGIPTPTRSSLEESIKASPLILCFLRMAMSSSSSSTPSAIR